MWMALGIVTALFDRQRNGEPAACDVSTDRLPNWCDVDGVSLVARQITGPIQLPRHPHRRVRSLWGLPDGLTRGADRHLQRPALRPALLDLSESPICK
jgi:crotonobetainyl-CoA:carnitine CoA-transferase CaiB-like acyl-CoA transferase